MRKLSLITLFALFCLLAPNVSADKQHSPNSPNRETQDLTEVQDLGTPETAMHEWLVSKMMQYQPPGVKRHKSPEAVETAENGRARYMEIADAIIQVAYDPNEKPLNGSKYGRAMSMVLLAAVAGHESRYLRNVDLGLGDRAQGDNGKSWCMVQINLGRAKERVTPLRVTLEEDLWHYSKKDEAGFSGPDLIQDRTACFRVGLHMMRRSWNGCSSHPVLHRLSVYTSGQDCTTGVQASANRVRTAMEWMAQGKPPMDDASMMRILHSQPPSNDNMSALESKMAKGGS